jgi:DNA-binding transcriptional regulator YhcF (GntR family)
MLTIRLDSPLPLIDQVRVGIRQAIATGDLAPGDALPTVRQLAADLGINLNTVARAYRQLESEGLVSTRRGRGTVVEAARETPGEPSESIKHRIAEQIRTLFADARLAGLSAADVERLLAEESSAIWPGMGAD